MANKVATKKRNGKAVKVNHFNKKFLDYLRMPSIRTPIIGNISVFKDCLMKNVQFIRIDMVAYR